MKLNKILLSSTLDRLQTNVYKHNLMGYKADGGVSGTTDGVFLMTMGVTTNRALKAASLVAELSKEPEYNIKFSFPNFNHIVDSEELKDFRKDYTIQKPLLILNDELVFEVKQVNIARRNNEPLSYSRLIEREGGDGFSSEVVKTCLNNKVLGKIFKLMLEQDNPFVGYILKYNHKNSLNHKDELVIALKQNVSIPSDRGRENELDSVTVTLSLVDLNLIKILNNA